MKKILILVVGFAAFAVMAVLLLPTEKSQSDASNANVEAELPPEPVVAMALASKAPLQAGMILRVEDFYFLTVPEPTTTELNQYFWQGLTDVDELVGSLITRPLNVDSLLSQDAIIRPNQSHYVSSILAPGKRALTLELNQEAVSYGLLKPGNYVDVLLASSVDMPADQGLATSYSSQLVLEGIRLLAIGDVVNELVSLDGKDDDDNEIGNFDPVRVTLEVSPEQAPKLLLAKKLGDLSLLLRSHMDVEMVNTAGKTSVWGDQVSDNHNPEKHIKKQVRIFDGGSIRNSTDSTLEN